MTSSTTTRRTTSARIGKNRGDGPVIDDSDGRIATDFGVTVVPESGAKSP